MNDELPPGWATARLESLVGPDGIMTDGDWIESKDQDPNGEVRLIQLADVGDGSFLDKSRRFLTRGKAQELSCTFLDTRDVLIARLGDPLGKACLFPQLNQPCVTVVDVHIVRPSSDDISREWLVHLINSPVVRRDIESQSSGTTRKRISGQKLKALPIRVPPAEEQRRIASKVNELFSRIDEGERALERVRSLVEHYRQCVLKAAISGELTRDWRKRNEDKLESGDALLARILDDRREAWENGELKKMKAKGISPDSAKWKQRYKQPVSSDVSRLPELPTGWAWASLEQLAAPEPHAITDGPFGSNLKTEHYTDSGPRVIRLQNIKDGVFGDDRAHISPAHFARLQKHQVSAGDLLIAALGESLPRACVAPADLGPAIVKADCIRFRASLRVIPYCIVAFLNSPPSRRRTEKIIHGVGRPRLNLNEIRSLPVPLPPVREQRLIADRIASQLASADHLLVEAARTAVHTAGLRQSTLRRAFQGGLVPHDSADESAAVLLERVVNPRGTREGRGSRDGNGKSAV
jgi:type I restriction enzyme, S subunit